MKKVYLDTSAFVKLFFDELDWHLVEKVTSLAKDNRIRIVISEWVLNEAVWTVEKKVLKGKIGSGDAFKVINHIADTIQDGIKDHTIIWLSFSEDTVTNSRVLIEEIHCSAADALHVYFARTSECDYFISADEELVIQIRFGGLQMESAYLHSSEDMDKFFNAMERA